MSEPVLGVVFAGGQSRRMAEGGLEGPKAELELAGQTLLARVTDRARPQVSRLILNQNGAPTASAVVSGLPVIADSLTGFQGPLAGLLTAMEAAEQDEGWIASFACDAPFVPMDFVDRCLAQADADGADIVLAMSDGRSHPVAGLWRVSLKQSLEAFLASGERKVDRWTAQHAETRCVFASEPYDPFFNINRPDDLKLATEIAAGL